MAKKRGPVAEDVVFETINFLHPLAATLVELLWWTGARPSEIFSICPQDIDRSGAVWLATLRHHKNARRGQARVLDFGPNAQRLLRRYLDRVPAPQRDKPIFSPAIAMAEHQHLRRAARKSKVLPSHEQRYERLAAQRSPREYGDRYTATVISNSKSSE